jgi:hypothetical protein
MHTQDFEAVIRGVLGAITVVSVYSPEAKDLTGVLAKDAAKLKTDLIRVIAGRHPARPGDIDARCYHACRKFLSNFVGTGVGGKIYTMNYDLLLYWALMHVEEDPKERIALTHDDGFRKDQNNFDAPYVEWQGEGAAHGQNIHYLHGALHLFDAGHQLQKYTWVNTGKPLVEQANEAVAKNLFPLFVAEGDTTSKLAKIQHSAYLHHNFKSFVGMCQNVAKTGTSLFVFGHSFGTNDAHVLNQIGLGNLSHVFVGLHGDPNSDSNQSIQKAVELIASMRMHKRPFPTRVDYFDSDTAKAWG